MKNGKCNKLGWSHPFGDLFITLIIWYLCSYHCHQKKIPPDFHPPQVAFVHQGNWQSRNVRHIFYVDSVLTFVLPINRESITET